METLSISSPWGPFIVILRQEKHVVNVIMFLEVSFTYKPQGRDPLDFNEGAVGSGSACAVIPTLYAPLAGKGNEQQN